MKIKIGDKVKIKRGTWFNKIFYIGDITGIVTGKSQYRNVSILSIDDEFRTYFLSSGHAADYFYVCDDDLKKINIIHSTG